MLPRKVEMVLTEMARQDAGAANDARAVYEWIAGENDVDTIRLSRVQRFAWYDLSVKWMVSDQDRRDALAAGATLFDALGLESYASVFRSTQTSEILAAHDWGHEEGLKSFKKAFAASGVHPPDLDDFTWSDLLGSEEMLAHEAVDDALEEEIRDGRITPGARGWKAKAAAITTEVLDGQHPELPGQSWRSAVTTERLYSRLQLLEGRAPQLHALMARHDNRLLDPIQPPTDLDTHMDPILWFLEWCVDDVEMTQAGYLPTAMVHSGAERFGWEKGWIGDAPQKESDSMELMALHELLLNSRAIRHRKDTVKTTVKGRRMTNDTEYAWRTVAASLTSHIWTAAVLQIFTLLILEGETTEDVLADEAHPILMAYGWRTEAELPDIWDVKRAWWSVRRPLGVLGGFTGPQQVLSRTAELTPFGEATLLEHLRLDMTGPMRH